MTKDLILLSLLVLTLVTIGWGLRRASVYNQEFTQKCERLGGVTLDVRRRGSVCATVIEVK